MRAIAAIITLVLAGLAATGVQAAPKVSFETSPGGLHYVRVFLPKEDRFAIEVAWPTDWATRKDANQRVPSVGARAMLIGGAEGYTSAAAAEALNDLNAETRLSAASEFVWGSLQAPRGKFEAALKLVNAFLRAPTLDEKWLARARNDIVADVTQSQTMPGPQALEAAGWAMLGNTPLRDFLSTGTREEIDAVTRDDVKTWQQEAFTRTGAKIAIAGDIDAKEAGKAVDALFAGLPKGKPVIANDAVADMQPRRVLLHMPEAKTSVLAVIGKLPSVAQGVATEDLFLVEALGGAGGVVNEALRGQLRATYSIGWGMPFYSRQNRVFLLMGEVETAKLAAAETALLKAYDGFHHDMTPLALDSIRNSLQSDLEDDGRTSGRAVDAALYAITTERPLDMLVAPSKFLKTVSEESLRNRLQEKFPPAAELMVFAASPDANALPGACVITKPEQAAGCK